jgi:hypothetical protein
MFGPRATAPLGEKARASADKLVQIAEALVPGGEGDLFGSFTIADSPSPTPTSPSCCTG